MANRVMTILEAHVETHRWADLEAAYRTATERLDPGIVQTFLVHSAADLSLWRIMTVWASREALDEMRRSGETPRRADVSRGRRRTGAFDLGRGCGAGCRAVGGCDQVVAQTCPSA